MARFTIRGKIYNTDKMKLIGRVRKWYEFQNWFFNQIYGGGIGLTKDCDLYRSDKGSYLLVHENGSELIGEAIDEDEAKNLLMRYDYDRYAELFGELEEA